MIVLDASVIANLVADDGGDGAASRAVLRSAGAAAVPDLADVETVAVLRKRWIGGDLSDDRFRLAVADLVALPMQRYPAAWLMPRAYELRANVTPYDASYVALAELLGCALLTCDHRLANAPGPRCPVRLLRS